MKVYISGPITGRPFAEAKKAFDIADALLRMQNHDPVNPITLCAHQTDPKWLDCMSICLNALLDGVEAIYMLDGWGASRGARIEYAIAREMGLQIIFQSCNAAISKAETLNR